MILIMMSMCKAVTGQFGRVAQNCQRHDSCGGGDGWNDAYLVIIIPLAAFLACAYWVKQCDEERAAAARSAAALRV
jgi:hypothetical protein